MNVIFLMGNKWSFDNLINWLSSGGLLFSILLLLSKWEMLSNPSLYFCSYSLDLLMSSSPDSYFSVSSIFNWFSDISDLFYLFWQIYMHEFNYLRHWYYLIDFIMISHKGWDYIYFILLWNLSKNKGRVSSCWKKKMTFTISSSPIHLCCDKISSRYCRLQLGCRQHLLRFWLYVRW